MPQVGTVMHGTVQCGVLYRTIQYSTTVHRYSTTVHNAPNLATGVAWETYIKGLARMLALHMDFGLKTEILEFVFSLGKL